MEEKPHTKFTAVFFHEDCDKHETPADHPEANFRASSIVEEGETIDSVEVIRGKVKGESQTYAILATVHTEEHLAEYKRFARKDKLSPKPEKMYPERKNGADGDMYWSVGTHQAIIASVSVSLDACNYVLSGRGINAFAAIRPPGHHAHANYKHGFCIVNNVVIAAFYLASKGKKILIVDIDAHHGDGTLDILSQVKNKAPVKNIRFIDRYSGDKPTRKAFVKHGKLTSEQQQFADVKMMPWETRGRDYLKEMDNALESEIFDKFEIDIILISAGFDGHESDELVGLNLNSKDYGKVVRKIYEKTGCGKIVMFLEGGYHERHLPQSAKSAIVSLANIALEQQKKAMHEFVNQFKKGSSGLKVPGELKLISRKTKNKIEEIVFAEIEKALTSLKKTCTYYLRECEVCMRRYTGSYFGVEFAAEIDVPYNAPEHPSNFDSKFNSIDLIKAVALWHIAIKCIRTAEDLKLCSNLAYSLKGILQKSNFESFEHYFAKVGQETFRDDKMRLSQGSRRAKRSRENLLDKKGNSPISKKYKLSANSNCTFQSRSYMSENIDENMSEANTAISNLSST